MKLAAVAQRGSKKDFIDVYALARGARQLQTLLDGYRQKYAIADVAHVLYSLTYFDDADRERMPRMLWAVGWPTVKGALRDWLGEMTE